MSKIHYSLCGSKTCKQAINDYPDYRIFWRSGFAYRGAGEREIVKSEYPKECACRPYYDEQGRFRTTRVMTFEEEMQSFYNWAAAIDVTIDHDAKEIHINGFSVNDME